MDLGLEEIVASVFRGRGDGLLSMFCFRFGSDDYALARMLHNRRFDNAMVDFLECLRQVLEVAVKQNSRIKIPFRYVSLPSSVFSPEWETSQHPSSES